MEDDHLINKYKAFGTALGIKHRTTRVIQTNRIKVPYIVIELLSVYEVVFTKGINEQQ